MYIKLDTDQDDLLAYKIAGKLSTVDYGEIEQEMELAIKQHGKIRVLVEIDHIKFPEVGVFWEDLKFSVRHINDFTRFAAVGDKAWEKWWVNIVGSMIPADARYFDISEAEAAWRWVKSSD